MLLQTEWSKQDGPSIRCLVKRLVLSKQELSLYIVQVSEEMAKSGDYHDSFAIEMELRREGFAEAGNCLRCRAGGGFSTSSAGRRRSRTISIDHPG